MFLSLLALSLTLSAPGRAATTPQKLPTYAIPSLWGGTCTNRDYRGKVAVVEVWSAGCPHCVRQAAHMESLAKSLDFKKFAIVAIHAIGGRRSRAAVAPLFQNKKIHVCLDNMSFVKALRKLPARYRVGGVPHMFIVDKKGAIRDVVKGAHSPEKLKKLLNKYK